MEAAVNELAETLECVRWMKHSNPCSDAVFHRTARGFVHLVCWPSIGDPLACFTRLAASTSRVTSNVIGQEVWRENRAQ